MIHLLLLVNLLTPPTLPDTVLVEAALRVSIDSSIALSRANGYGVTSRTPAFVDGASFHLSASKAGVAEVNVGRLTADLASSKLLNKAQSESCTNGRCVLRDSVIKVESRAIQATTTGLTIEITARWSVAAPSPRLAHQLHIYQAVFEKMGGEYRLISIKLAGMS